MFLSILDANCCTLFLAKQTKLFHKKFLNSHCSSIVNTVICHYEKVREGAEIALLVINMVSI